MSTLSISCVPSAMAPTACTTPSHDPRVPAPHAAAARRCPWMPARHDPEADPQRAPSLPEAPRHFPPARDRGEEREVRPLRRDRDRLRPHRRLRAAPRRRQAPYVPGDRPCLEVHLRRVPRARQHHHRTRLPAQRRRRVPVPDPHRAHRQRHPLRRPAEEPRRAHRPPARPYVRSRLPRARHRAPAHQTPPSLANGQAERMNRTIKDATVKAFHYENLESLKAHVLAFVTAYNFAKHLKALRWRTPFQAIQEAWTKDPSPFKINPHQLIPRPNT